jgi:hypothetical protein
VRKLIESTLVSLDGVIGERLVDSTVVTNVPYVTAVRILE